MPAIVEFDVDGTPIYFETNENIAEGVVARTGSPGAPIEGSVQRLSEAADATAKLAASFATAMHSLAVDSIEIEMALEVTGKTNFVFVGGGGKGAIKVKVKIKPQK